MPSVPPAFIGSVPEKYERYLGPYCFEPYARDLVSRIRPDGIQAVLEIACGTGRVTSHLRKLLLPGTRLVATDLNADMITIARQTIPGQNLAQHAIPDLETAEHAIPDLDTAEHAIPDLDTAEHAIPNLDIEWKVADAQTLPFEDNSFDLLVCQFGLMFVPDKAAALSEAHRVLKPGGRLLLSTWDGLKNNPAFFLADQIVSKYFPADPPRFFHIPFSLHDKNELASLLDHAGFKDHTISLVKIPGKNSSAMDTATGMLEGTPVYSAIMERSPELLPLIKTKVERELSRQFGKAPMESPMQAWIIEATRS